MAIIGLGLSCSIPTWAQNYPLGNAGRRLGAISTMPPGQVTLVPSPLTIFDNDISRVDQPFVTLSFSTVSADLGSHTSLNLVPLGLASLDAPQVLKTLAVEFHLSQSDLAARNAEVPQFHSVVTILDFNELPAFRSLFNALAVTGMPQPAVSGAKPTVRMTSRSGMRLEFTADTDGRILLVATTEADTVSLSLDADLVRKCADAFTAADRTLDAAKGST